jgi:hypothetical protein
MNIFKTGYTQWENPAITFESQVLFFDMTNTILPSKKFGDKVSIGVTVGVPFSKVIY